jgi:hypothetical protein
MREVRSGRGRSDVRRGKASSPRCFCLTWLRAGRAAAYGHATLAAVRVLPLPPWISAAAKQFLLKPQIGDDDGEPASGATWQWQSAQPKPAFARTSSFVRFAQPRIRSREAQSVFSSEA